MNQLQHYPDSLPASQNLPTTPFTASWLDTLRKGICEANGQPILPAGLSISESQRRSIEADIVVFRAHLTPQPDNHRRTAIVLAKLLAAFPAQSQSDAPIEQRMEAYFEALHGVPAWAVDRARLDIIAGRADGLSGVWAPTPPQLAKIARSAMRRDQAILADLERVAAAKPYEDIDLAERKRVAAGFDKLRADLVMPKPI